MALGIVNIHSQLVIIEIKAFFIKIGTLAFPTDNIIISLLFCIMYFNRMVYYIMHTVLYHRLLCLYVVSFARTVFYTHRLTVHVTIHTASAIIREKYSAASRSKTARHCENNIYGEGSSNNSYRRRRFRREKVNLLA